jgi:sugar lactone lactonase YvrE
MTLTGGQASLEVAVDARASLGEGPVWDAARGILWWVDVTAGAVHGFDPRSGADRALAMGSFAGAVALRRDGSVVVALADALCALDPDDGRPVALLDLGSGGGLRCNDAKCDPAGRLWVGRLAMDLAPGLGSLLRVDPDLALTTRLEGLTIPNGMGWSPDGGRMYFIDSTWLEVREHPYDTATGTMGEGRPIIRFADDGSVPDGMTVDAEGHLWVARWGAGCVVRVAPDGTVVDRIDLPVSRVSSCTFGGADLDDLYITTARGDDVPATDPAHEPLGGALFRCRPGVRGLPAIPFAG